MMDVRPIERKALERIAHIVGEASAAAKALKHAETISDPMFFETTAGTIIVLPRSAFEAVTSDLATETSR